MKNMLLMILLLLVYSSPYLATAAMLAPMLLITKTVVWSTVDEIFKACYCLSLALSFKFMLDRLNYKLKKFMQDDIT